MELNVRSFILWFSFKIYLERWGWGGVSSRIWIVEASISSNESTNDGVAGFGASVDVAVGYSEEPKSKKEENFLDSLKYM